MRVRKQDAAGDYVVGPDAFWVDCPEGVAQVLKTRLALFAASWFYDLTAGMPWAQAVLGKTRAAQRDAAIRGCIAGTPGVKSILRYAAPLDTVTRVLTVTVRLATDYGKVDVETYLNTSPGGPTA